jgi:sialic acid synthase SpsE
MIKTAAEIGIDYIKFQAFKANNLNKNWLDYENAYKYYKSVELKDEDYAFIMQKCKEHDIKPIFTVFHTSLVMPLYNAGVKIIKIASPDAKNLELIDKCCGLFNKVIVSTGMSTNAEIKALQKAYDVDLLYCISKYPTDYLDIDFDKMQLFDGFSDHTLTIEASKKAIDLGMGYIERHYTLCKDLPGKDHILSSTPEEFRKLVEHRNYIEKCKLYKTRWNNG